MSRFIWEEAAWPHFTYNKNTLVPLLQTFFYNYGMLEALFLRLDEKDKSDIICDNLSKELYYSSLLSDIKLDKEMLSNSIIRELELKEIEYTKDNDKNSDEIVKSYLKYFNDTTISGEKLKEIYKSLVGEEGVYRNIHSSTYSYNTVPVEQINKDLDTFITFFNDKQNELLALIIKSAITLLLFSSIHPFEKHNDLVSRFLSLLPLTIKRKEMDYPIFYIFCISEALYVNKETYINALQNTQIGSLDITNWLYWYISLLNNAVMKSGEKVNTLFQKKAFFLRVSRLPIKLNDRQLKVLNLLFENLNEELTEDSYKKAVNCEKEIAKQDLDQLVLVGLLVKENDIYLLN